MANFGWQLATFISVIITVYTVIWWSVQPNVIANAKAEAQATITPLQTANARQATVIAAYPTSTPTGCYRGTSYSYANCRSGFPYP